MCNFISKLTELNWYVVRSKFRKELKARNYFQGDGYEAFVPCILTVSQKDSEKIEREVPAISGYVFVRLPKFNYKPFNDNPLVTDVIKSNGKVVEVMPEEVDLMKRHLSTDYLSSDFKNVEVGNLISLEHGVFSGYQGKVVEVKNNKIIINLKSISMRLSISLN